MASKEANNLDNLLIIYLYGMDLPDLSSSTDYVFDFDHFIAKSFDGGEKDVNFFKFKPIH